MWADFKKFIMRGNVMDLAIAVVIGAAFGAIITSVVNDIIMPVIGVLLAGISFTDLKIVLAEAVMENGAVVKPEAAIMYGHLVQVILQFLIIALVIFLVVKALTRLQKKKEAPAPAPAAKPADVLLLEEIRDLLKNTDKTK